MEAAGRVVLGVIDEGKERLGMAHEEMRHWHFSQVVDVGKTRFLDLISDGSWPKV